MKLFNFTSVRAKAFVALFSALAGLASCEGKEELSPNEAFNPNHVLNKKTVGESARDLLSAGKFTRVILEIQSAQGYAPTAEAVNSLKQFMEQRLNKPGGVILRQSTIPAPGKTSYTADDIKAIEDQHRKEFTRPDTIAVYFFFADSRSADDTDNSRILGVAYRNTSMAVFGRTIHDISGGLTQPETSQVETVILQHELGHILGLVNTGTPMVTNHQDTPHGRHCTNTDCLMYYAMETGSVVQRLLGSGTPQLDARCLEDLKANGGK